MRALSFVLFAALVSLAAGACGPPMDRVVCEHCYCESWGARDLTHPLSCTTLRRDPACCPVDTW